MVFNATFNDISVISWWSVLLVEETGGPGENMLKIAKFPFKLPVFRFMACDYPLWYQTFLKIKTGFISHPTTGYLDNRCSRELRSYLRHME